MTVQDDLKPLGSFLRGVDTPASPQDGINKVKNNFVVDYSQQLINQGVAPKKAKQVAIKEYERQSQLGLGEKPEIKEGEYFLDTDTFIEDLEAEDEKSKIPLTIEQKIIKGLSAIEKKIPGIQVIYTGTSEFGGVNFGIPTKPKKIKGINYPENFYYLCDEKSIPLLVNEAIVEIKHKECREFWLPLFLSDYGSPIAKAISKMSWIPKEKSISIDGRYGAFSCLPKMEWFDEKVKALNIDHLLAILPDAERDTFLLHLGRTMVGTGKNLEGENPLVELPDLEFGYRTIPILFGEAEVGKSTLIKNLIRGMTKAGYTYDAPSLAFNQFSFDAAKEHLMFIDDLQPNGLETLLYKSNHIKTIAAGNPIKLEKKGQTPYRIIPKASIIICVNDLQMGVDLDPGMLSRIHCLQTKTHSQLKLVEKTTGKDMRTKEYWEKTATELEVEIETLALFVLRSATDMMLKEIGVTTTPMKQDVTKNTLHQRLGANKQNYVYQPPRNIVKTLCSASRKAYAITAYCKQKLGEEIQVNPEYDMSFNGFSLYHLAQTVVKIQERIDTYKETLKRDDLNEAHTKQVKNNINAFSELKNWLEVDEIGYSTWTQFIEFWHNQISPEGQKIELGRGHTFSGIWQKVAPLITLIDGSQIVLDRPKYHGSFKQQKLDTEAYINQVEQTFQCHGIKVKRLDLYFGAFKIELPDFK
jgi:hypothetical protein